MKELSLGIEEVNQLKNPYMGTVSLAFLQTLGITILPDILRRFTEQYPHVNIQLHQNKISNSINQLLDREVDLCLISKFEEHPDIRWRPLLHQELFVYVPSNHRLADKTSIELAELSKDSFIGYKEVEMQEIIRRFCAEAGFAPAVKYEGDDVSTLAGLVSAGLGVTIIPEFHGVARDKIKRIPLSKPHCIREIGFAWLKEKRLSPSAELFLACAFRHQF
ncbi:LysR substrate-binding domain-containing protein [Paenibacillus sp. M1]|uniref:LysR substrate-binding domain-containing protein n=1 Tax=Paenibacillus haidiansis TaxID=1574488 RepID=A0ABU7VQS9_9BACL